MLAGISLPVRNSTEQLELTQNILSHLMRAKSASSSSDIVSTAASHGRYPQEQASVQAPSRSVMIEEQQSRSGQVSDRSKLVEAETVEDITDIAEIAEVMPTAHTALVKDSLRIDERELMLTPPNTPDVEAQEPEDIQTIMSSQPISDQPLSVAGTAVSIITEEEKARRAALNAKLRYQIVDQIEPVADPLDFEIKASSSEPSGQALLVARSAATTTEGTQAPHDEIAMEERVHSPTRFIVKFKNNWPNALEACAQKIHTLGLEFKDYLSDGSSSIDQLNRICRIQNVKSLFMKRGQLNTQEATLMQSAKMSASMEKFKDRTMRAQERPPIPDLVNTYVFEVPDGSDIKKICALYEADSHVEFAQPDYAMVPNVFPADPPNDPRYLSHKWDLNNSGQFGGVNDADIDASESWPINLGDGIIVAVVDGGIDYEHVELADNMWINPGEDLNNNGIVDGTNSCPVVSGDFNCVDDDNNGQVDDIRGYDFGDDDNDPIFFSEDGETDWHGTFVSGMIAAKTNNGVLVSSIAPNATIMAVKGFPDVGNGFISSLASAVVYAAMNGADVINNSWGCLDPCPSNPLAESAVSTAYGLGAVLVYSAGNDALDVADFSPQNMPETITVAATDNRDERAFFSNIGGELDVSAPGYDVYAISPFDQFAIASGTSFAAPLVSGVAALILSEHPTMTNEQVKWVLRQSADDIDAVGFDENTGAGRLNAQQALLLNRVVPSLQVIGNKTVNTGTILQFLIFAIDFRSDPLTFTAEISGGAALSTIDASLTDNGDGSATFSWTPDAAQAGLNPQIVFTVTDSPGGFSDSETITITVNLGTGVCGNNILEPGEECDDGDVIDGDGCSLICTNEVCGNLRVDLGESCDNDAGPTSGDGCTNTCDFEFCGDGVVNNSGSEECDDGGLSPTCSFVCQSIICGNSRVDPGEQCDEGGDTADCDINCMWKDVSCGNDRVDTNEQCDDGNLVSGDGCNNACEDEFCGDGIVNDTDEDCDTSAIIPPSSFDNDDCSSICRDQECGNGVVDLVLGEECDATPGCSSACKLMSLAVCGNGMCEADRAETCASCQLDCGYCRGLRPR